MSFTELRSLISTAGSLVIPSIKLCAGIWFLKQTASFIWKWTKPILKFGRKGQPRFASGRVEKFYKCTPPRLKRRRQKKVIQKERRQINRKLMKTLETVKVEEVDESIIKSDSLGVGNIDLNKIIKDNFIMCAGKECWCTSSVGKQNKTDFQDITVDEIILKRASENVNEEDQSESSERSSVCEIHNRIVKGIGLKCISSDAPLLNDHNHQSCSPREAQVQEEEVGPRKYINSVQRQHYYDEFSLLPPSSNVIHHSTCTSEFPCPFTSIKCSTPLSNHVRCASFKMSLLSDEGSLEMDTNFDFSEAMVENNSLGEHIVVDVNDLSTEDKESKSTATCEQMPTSVKVNVNQDCKPEVEHTVNDKFATFVEAATSSTDTSNEEETCDNSIESDIYIHVSYK